VLLDTALDFALGARTTAGVYTQGSSVTASPTTPSRTASPGCSSHHPNVRFGSLADIGGLIIDVRFDP